MVVDQYMPYVPGLTGYGMAGSNTLYPNWNQGNSLQYYTGGTGTGLVNTGYPWYRSLQNIPYQGAMGPTENPSGHDPSTGMNLPPGFNANVGPNVPAGFNPMGPMKKSAPARSSSN